MAASELLPPVQRTLPPSSCPFILEITLPEQSGGGVRLSWLTPPAAHLWAVQREVGAGSSGG